MDKLTSFVLAHRRLVAVFWLLAVVAGGVRGGGLSKHLSQDFAIPGTPSDTAARAIVADYGSGGSEDPLVLVVRLPAGRTIRQPLAITAALRVVSAPPPALRPKRPGRPAGASQPGGLVRQHRQ